MVLYAIATFSFVHSKVRYSFCTNYEGRQATIFRSISLYHLDSHGNMLLGVVDFERNESTRYTNILRWCMKNSSSPFWKACNSPLDLVDADLLLNFSGRYTS
jgi:hypothetical protein